MKRFALILVLPLALAACTDAFYTQQAGAMDDPAGAFSVATENNILIQSGQKSFAVALAERFEAEVPSTVNFDFDSAVLDASARATLDRQAQWIRQFPEVRFSVYGHTDLVGSAAYNQRLGQRRAQAVVNYLVSRGVERQRLQALVSFGETRPLIVTAEPERRNRRTVTEVSGFVQRHPTVMDGRYAEIIRREYVESATRQHPR